ncbi:hypothetical protein [Fructobacillus tropaeoli]|uniref:Glucose-6-phosphate isomerase n=1 Tax=Fructobacillus tropaeoli TaxID=709323 RepID=A0A3F3HH94_9LACO|nr:hypothetical protein [Fructobacillus tropaeoli]GAP04929.1 glucose-6-phosphate isomerase [Fructobacillus tropaeoli]
MSEESNRIARDIYKLVEPLWKKQRNTLYELRVVMPKFQHGINVFFEWNKLGKSTTSRAIKSYKAIEKDEVLEAVEFLKKEYNLTVKIYD